VLEKPGFKEEGSGKRKRATPTDVTKGKAPQEKGASKKNGGFKYRIQGGVRFKRLSG